MWPFWYRFKLVSVLVWPFLFVAALVVAVLDVTPA